MQRQNQKPQPDICFCQVSEKQFQSCFHKDNLQKVRICEDEMPERLLQLLLFFVVSVSTVLAGVSIKHLHKVSDCRKLFKSTESCLFFFPSTPVIHRSVVFRHLEEGDHEELETMFKTCSVRPKGSKQVETIVNKANFNGDTPLHLSTSRGNSEEYARCTVVLLKAGAIPAPNYDNKIPNIRTHLHDKEVVKKLIEAKQKNRLSTYCIRQLKDQAEGQSSAELKHLLSLEGVGGDYVAKEGVVLRQFTDQAKVGARVPVRAGDDLEVSNHNPLI